MHTSTSKPTRKTSQAAAFAIGGVQAPAPIKSFSRTPGRNDVAACRAIYHVFADHSIFVQGTCHGIAVSAGTHTLATLTLELEPSLKKGCPLPATLRELMGYVIRNEDSRWSAADLDKAYQLLAASAALPGAKARRIADLEARPFVDADGYSLIKMADWTKEYVGFLFDLPRLGSVLKRGGQAPTDQDLNGLVTEAVTAINSNFFEGKPVAGWEYYSPTEDPWELNRWLNTDTDRELDSLHGYDGD